MSIETLANRDEFEINDLKVVDEATKVMIGRTVFEALSIDSDEAFEISEETDIRILNSVTRLGDGQTVRDEN